MQTVEIAGKLKSHHYELVMLDFVGLWALFALQFLRFGRVSWRRLASCSSPHEKRIETN